ncbi:hypothetical protein EVAR_65263_1 [Eumeta japonica]|uniref:Uncharacterized protein n=1 Tax=Eumeta variegata TaxID=151549 RepID=A0A4C1Z8F4_EUMVA|nr:hypothetical protein EVAR_65263_1 [Eumeta japonica]
MMRRERVFAHTNSTPSKLLFPAQHGHRTVTSRRRGTRLRLRPGLPERRGQRFQGGYHKPIVSVLEFNDNNDDDGRVVEIVDENS